MNEKIMQQLTGLSGKWANISLMQAHPKQASGAAPVTYTVFVRDVYNGTWDQYITVDFPPFTEAHIRLSDIVFVQDAAELATSMINARFEALSVLGGYADLVGAPDSAAVDSTEDAEYDGDMDRSF